MMALFVALIIFSCVVPVVLWLGAERDYRRVLKSSRLDAEMYEVEIAALERDLNEVGKWVDFES